VIVLVYCFVIVIALIRISTMVLPQQQQQQPQLQPPQLQQREQKEVVAFVQKVGSLFHHIHNLHHEHGIYPFHNYAQYTKYCSQRLSRIRHNPSIQPYLVHNGKYHAVVAVVSSSASSGEAMGGGSTATAAITTATATITTNTNTTTVAVSRPPQQQQQRRKHAYYSRRPVYDSILSLVKKEPLQERTEGTADEEDHHSDGNQNDGTTEIHTDDDTIPSYCYHENMVWNLLYQSERAWAQACDLLQQQQQTTASSSQPHSSLYPNKNRTLSSSSAASSTYKKKKSNHGHAQRRFNKAYQWSQLLYEIVTAMVLPPPPFVSSQTTLCTRTNTTNSILVQECYSYMKWMQGNVALEHKDYVGAFQAYKESMMILYDVMTHHDMDTTITSTTNTTTISTEQLRNIWTQRMDHVLRPLVRYCQYESKDELLMLEDVSWTMDPTTTAATRTAATSSSLSSSTLIVIPFRGMDIILDHEHFSQQITVLYWKLEPQLQLYQQLYAAEDVCVVAVPDDTVGLQFLSDLDDTMTEVMSELKACLRNHAKDATISTSSSSSSSSSVHKCIQLMTFYSYLNYYKLSIWRRQQEQRIATAVTTFHISADDGSSDKSNMNTSNSSSSSMDSIEILHLYTSLQQIVLSMTELVPLSITTLSEQSFGAAAVANVTTSTAEDPYALEAQAHVLRVRAFRCYYMALYYEKIGQEQQQQQQYRFPASTGGGKDSSSWEQHYVLPLLQHAQVLTKRAIEEMAACGDETTILLSSDLVQKYIEELEQLNLQIKAVRCRIEATCYLLQQGIKDDATTTTANKMSSISRATTTSMAYTERPLWLRYDEDPDTCQGSVLVDVPPVPIPMPCKGVFYDIADHYMDEIVQKEIIQSLQEYCSVDSAISNQMSTTTTASTNAFSKNNILQWFSSSSK
jgi:RNA-binding signal recognition particle 68